MAGLQRSAVSFRRQGSSGLVWDDKFLSGELNQVNQKEDNNDQDHHKSEIKDLKVAVDRSSKTIQRSRSNGGYRTGKVAPAIEPPSPKLSACGFCSAFGKSGGDRGQRKRRKPAKPRSR
ncbi:MAPK kinase substrate protein At1g80180-like [Prosopis cineraria]|uniref:MAPK kinase substrate protein At1g80180-like n=1 Tax=Prosopis cineraria TaxID=364024 RepID=UPI00240FFC05|nr:MAPK kinase substrate protein At1g80180-like [Prosopis cineraria]